MICGAHTVLTEWSVEQVRNFVMAWRTGVPNCVSPINSRICHRPTAHPNRDVRTYPIWVVAASGRADQATMWPAAHID